MAEPLAPRPRFVALGGWLTIFVALGTCLGVIAGSIWYVAIWTSKIEGRIEKLEYRVDWIDREKNEDRAEAKDVNKKLVNSLYDLNNLVQRLDAIVNDKRFRR